MVLVVSTAQQPRAPTAAPLVVTPESSTGTAATLDQCRNGGVGATPVPCNPNTKNPLGWVNGNAQGQQAHWREGDSIAYRVIITGLTPGSSGNTLLFNWSTVHGSEHAIDYITSYDRTERNTTTPSQFYANNNNPCSDVLGATDCNPALPRTYFPIPSPVTNGVLTNCGGSSGTFVGAIPTGGDMQIKGFGAAGTVITAVAYQSVQDPSGTGQCSTGFAVTFTAGGSTVVLAWGGHIASQADWGVGNSASFISGSPYHMFLDQLNGASTGAQDRALATSAIFFTPTITTTVQYDSNNTAVVSPIALGTSVHDNATLTNASSIAGGTVTYNFWRNGVCSGTPFWTKTVTVTNAKVPNSNSTGPLAAGSYSFNATYSGDTSSNTFAAFSSCEPFTVGKKPTSITTSLVLGTSTPLANGATVDLGSSVHDTAAIAGAVSGVPLTGTVTYHFYTNGTCSAPSLDETVTISGGTVPPSSSHTSLAAGDYSFNATYSGDLNYAKSDSACEPFSVGKAPTGIFTSLVLGTSTPLANASTIALGSSVHDTSTVTGGVSGFPITGTVTYRFFLNYSCAAPAFHTWTVNVGQPSGTVGPLAAGSYSFNASYSGDDNYSPSYSACEKFSVGKAGTSIFTNIFTDSDVAVDNGSSIALGSSVFDTSTVGPQVNGFALTGTVTYRFFLNFSCAAPAFLTWTVGVGQVSGTVGPLAAGQYSFNASYSGDGNYLPSWGECEPFAVSTASTTIYTNLVQGTNTPLANGSTIALGSSVHDTSTVTGGVSGFPITGTVTYQFFLNYTCSEPAFLTSTVDVGQPSGTVGPLAAGDYSFNASYSGDKNYDPSFSACEPFHVAKAPTTTTTALVLGASTPLANGGTIALGSSVHDTSTVTGQVDSFAITGEVTYRFFLNYTCSAPAFLTWKVALGQNSGTVGPLAAGDYSFNASYAGNENYLPSFSACEPFHVAKGPTAIFTNLMQGAGTPLANDSTIALGSSVFDTSTVTGQVDSFAITGTVTYRFFLNDSCSAPAFATFAVSVGNPSSSVGPLAPGDYSFNASYAGNANYLPSFGACEPFHVAQGPTGTFTNLFNDTNVAVDNGSEILLGSVVHDTSTVTGGVSGFPITGTVTYRFFLNGSCDAPAFKTWTVAVGSASGSVGPLPAGDYSFNASYSGDDNYLGSFSACEPFTVLQFPVPPTVSTQVIVTGTTSPDVQGTNLAPGTSVHDTSTLTAPAGSSGVIAPTGTMTYHFYADASCGASDEITSLNGNTWPYSVDVTSFGSQSPSQETGALASGSYSFQAVYSGDGNYQGAASPCEPFTVSIPPSVTDTTFCPVSQFRLIFIQKTSSTYTLAASNPGQFYSNVFASLSSPGTLSVTINLPYPFVTQGAVPIQAFYNQPMPTCGSTVPNTNVNGEFTISPTSVTLSSYGASPTMGVTTVGVTFTSTGTLPAGLYWFAIHLDYGLKGQTFTMVDQGTGACANPPNTLGACAAGLPSYNFIGNPQAYAFSNSLSGSNPVTSTNSFNKDPGLAGVVTDSVGNPVAGAEVTITGGGITATTTTDQNGFYAFAFKGSGKTVTFTVTATYTYNAVTYTTSGTVTMRLNTIAVLDLSFGGLVL